MINQIATAFLSCIHFAGVSISDISYSSSWSEIIACIFFQRSLDICFILYCNPVLLDVYKLHVKQYVQFVASIYLSFSEVMPAFWFQSWQCIFPNPPTKSASFGQTTTVEYVIFWRQAVACYKAVWWHIVCCITSYQRWRLIPTYTRISHAHLACT